MLIEKMLTISIKHITKHTFDLMDDDNVGVICYPVDGYGSVYGFFVKVSDFEDYIDEIPSDLMACLEFAQKQDCDWLRMDVDYDRVSGLPVYDW